MDTSTLDALIAWLTAFYAVIALYYAKPSLFKRLGIEATPYAIILRKGYSFDFVDRLSPRARRALRVFFTLGILVYILAVIMFYQWIISVTMARLEGSVKGPAVVPIIPGVTVSIGFFLQLLPALGLAALIHEAFHGIAAKLEGIPVRSTGVMLLLGVIPAAFVEPLEDVFRRARLSSKLRILSAGIMGNMLLALIALSLLALLPAATKLVVVGFTPGSPAKKAGLQEGDVILYANSTPVTSVETLRRIIMESRVVNLTIERSGKLLSLLIPVAGEDGEKHIGIYVALRVPPLQAFLSLLYLINISLALINAAPLIITDGARILNETLSGFDGAGRALSTLIQVLTIGLLVVNIGIVRIG